MSGAARVKQLCTQRIQSRGHIDRDCTCFLNSNIFVHSVGRHFSFNGDRDQFVRENRELLSGSTPEDIDGLLSEIEAEVTRRTNDPNQAIQREKTISEEYTPLHPEVSTGWDSAGEMEWSGILTTQALPEAGVARTS